MVTYAKNELASATEISKQFGAYMSKVNDGVIEKIGVLKNNKLNAVILSVDKYEKMSIAMELLEDIEIYEQVKDRLNNPDNKLINGEDVLKKHGLSLSV